MATSHTTQNHDEIRRWAERRRGEPSCVKGTGGPEDVGVLRIDFPDYTGAESLSHISWDQWFEKFDERDLVFLFQEKTAEGKRSNFNKLISRETAEELEKGESGRRH